MPLVKINDVNVINVNKPFFDQTMKNKREAHGPLVEMLRNSLVIQQENC